MHSKSLMVLKLQKKKSNALINCDNETLYTVRLILNDECKFSWCYKI